MNFKLVLFLLMWIFIEAVFFFGIIRPFRDMIFKITNDFFPGVTAQDLNTIIFWVTASSIVVAFFLAWGTVSGVRKRKYKYP